MKYFLPFICSGFLWIGVGLSYLFSNPVGESVVAGSASFDRTGNTLTVLQSTDKLITNWQDFSIGVNELTRFIQPSSSSAVLNRVVSGNPSSILGSMSANGRVYLINPNGIVMGAGANINCGSFIASTLDAKDADFLKGGDLLFSGTSTASIVNLGKIAASDGDVFLMARQVQNQGDISAVKGSVGLASGTEILLKEAGSERLFVRAGEVTNGTGVDQMGMITAIRTELKSAGSVYSLAINAGGVVQATEVDEVGGEVYLRAPGGKIKQTGIINAQGIKQGGKVVVEGKQIAVGGTIDVSGGVRGGTINIGGGFQGNDASIQNADQVKIGSGATLSANGGSGEVVIWSDGGTEFYGALQAKGANVEISGKNNLAFDGAVDLGGTGSLLLDPQTLDINDAGAGTNRTLAADVDQFTDFTNETSYMTTAQLLSLLSAANVTLKANTDISFSSSLNASAALYLNKSLTVNAGRSITIKANIALTLNGGGFTATINDVGAQAGQRTAGDPLFSMNDGSSLTTNGGTISVTAGSFGGATTGEIVIGAGTTMATMNSGAGNITLTGIAPSTTNLNGVKLNKATLQSGNGTININGTGVNATSNAYGVVIQGASQVNSTGTGNILISGTGGTGTASSYGVYVTSVSSLNSSGTGGITINGTGGNGTGTFNVGVDLDTAGSFISSSAGDILINGTARGNNQLEDGIIINTGTHITSSGSGKITLNGTGSTLATGANNLGVWLNGSGLVNSYISAVDGDITINGTAGGNGAGNYGVQMGNMAVKSTGSGAINISGVGGDGTTSNYGIYETSGALIQSSGIGKITMNGTGGNGSGTGGIGINIDAANTLITSLTGDILMNGTGRGTAANEYGIQVFNGAQITSTGSAKITLNGTAGSAGLGTNLGLLLHGNGGATTKISSLNGDITINGTGSGVAGNSNQAGMWLTSGMIVESTGSSNITINGTGAAGTSNNHGVYVVNGSIVRSTGSGAVTFNGTGGNGTSTGNSGVRVESASSLITSTSGTITLNGTGGGTSTDEYGIMLYNGGEVTSTSGANIILNGTGGGSGTGNDYGFIINGNGGATTFISTTTGDVSIAGTGGGSGANNYGIFLVNGGMINSTGRGGISIAGTSAGTAMGIITSTGANSIGGALDSGNITLMASTATGADSISLSNLTVQTTGTVTLRPISDSTTIGVGTGSTGVFNLNATDLATVSAGTAGVVIGKTTGTGAVDIRATTWNDGVTILSPGSGGQAVTINGALTGGVNKNLVVATGGTIVNAVGAGAMVVSGTGKWLIYTPDAASSGITLNGTVPSATLNALSSSYLYNGTYGTLAPGSITQSGNRFVFATPATLTFTANNAEKYYGTENPALTYTFNGGLLGTDTFAKAFQGTLSESTTGNTILSPIVLSLGSGASDLNYHFNLVNGTLTTRFDVTSSTGTLRNVVDQTVGGRSDTGLIVALNGLKSDSLGGIKSPNETRTIFPLTPKLVEPGKLDLDELKKKGVREVRSNEDSGKILVVEHMNGDDLDALNERRENKAQANGILQRWWKKATE